MSRSAPAIPEPDVINLERELIQAIKINDIDKVRELINRGADIDYVDKEGKGDSIEVVKTNEDKIA